MKKTIFKGVVENMSKMRMPEMNVVRFTESDVIVASLYLYNWSDDIGKNGGIRYNGERVYSNAEADSTSNNLSLAFGTEDTNKINFYLPGNQTPVSLGGLIMNDNNHSAGNDGYDGYYTYDSIADRWVHQ